MKQNPKCTITASMKPKQMEDWMPVSRKKAELVGKKHLFATSAAICLCIGATAILQDSPQTQAVMNHLDTGFDYDDTLGRLQYVSSILPESAMVFLTNDDTSLELATPTKMSVVHAWSQQEPWIEYTGNGQIRACLGGEVMNVIQNRKGEYTVRLLHGSGYESVYSGLSDISFTENEFVDAGEILGYVSSHSAFELRRDGLSVLPVFSE